MYIFFNYFHLFPAVEILRFESPIFIFVCGASSICGPAGLKRGIRHKNKIESVLNPFPFRTGTADNGVIYLFFVYIFILYLKWTKMNYHRDIQFITKFKYLKMKANSWEFFFYFWNCTLRNFHLKRYKVYVIFQSMWSFKIHSL